MAWLKPGLEDQAVHRALLDAGIESLPLSVYSTTPMAHQGIVLGFCCTHENRIPDLVNRVSVRLDTMQ